MLKSIFLGLFSLIVLFFLCSVFVVGVKSVYLRYFYKPKPKQKPTPKPKQKRTTKSLTINPEEIDRIYVKKAS